MKTITFKVKTYQITLGHEMAGGGGGPKTRAHIVCHGADGERFVIYFAAPGSLLAPPWTGDTLQNGCINVPISEIGNYVDILRNESPIQACLFIEHPEWNCIQTIQEQVGEHENTYIPAFTTKGTPP